MTSKERLQTVLNGGAPDFPPHFEMVFQLGRECFGLDEATPNVDIKLPLRCVEEFGYAAVTTNIPRMAELKRELGGQALLFGFNGGAVYMMPSGENMMDFVVSLYEDPEGVHAQARRQLDETKELTRRYVDYGVDFFIMNSDFGFNTQPFISPAQFGEFVAPYMTEFVHFCHAEMKRPVLLHSDGHIAPLLEQIVATGVDGYQSVDPQGGMDIRDVRENYPGWALMGNVACNMLQDCNEASIRESVRYCMAHGGVGKRYIFSTSNCVFAGMPPESYRIMLDEYRRLERAAQPPSTATPQ